MGLRNPTLRALRYRDVKEELQAGVTPLLIRVYPEMKQVVPEVCKGRIPYFLFMAKEAVDALKAYLSDREARLGPLTDERVLFCSDDRRTPRERRPYMPLNMAAPEKILRRAAKTVGIRSWQHVRPHCLRKTFERAVRNSGLDTKDQGFFMGHVLPGSQDAYYDRTKVEELRAKYAKVEFFPSKGASSEEMRKRQILDMVRLLGFPEDRIRRVEEALAKYATVDEAMEEIRRLSLEGYRLRESPNEDPKKIVREEELEEYLANGWEFLTVLPYGRILLRRAHKMQMLLPRFQLLNQVRSQPRNLQRS